MIRFVYIGSQISSNERQFAFYDTVQDRFLDFKGDQVFSSLEDFKTSAKNHKLYERCLRLLPVNGLLKEDLVNASN